MEAIKFLKKEGAARLLTVGGDRGWRRGGAGR